MRTNESRALPALTIALLPQQDLVRRDAFIDRRALDLTAVREFEPGAAGEARRRRLELRHELRDELCTPQRDGGREPDQLPIPERDLRVGDGHLVARDTQQRVPLLEHPLVFAALASVSSVDLAEHRVEIPAARARRGTEQLDVLCEQRE